MSTATRIGRASHRPCSDILPPTARPQSPAMTRYAPNALLDAGGVSSLAPLTVSRQDPISPALSVTISCVHTHGQYEICKESRPPSRAPNRYQQIAAFAHALCDP